MDFGEEIMGYEKYKVFFPDTLPCPNRASECRCSECLQNKWVENILYFHPNYKSYRNILTKDVQALYQDNYNEWLMKTSINK